MTVLTAGTGREAIDILESTPDLAIVLMDIMMPEMDGYETMEVIRAKYFSSPFADHRPDGQSDEGGPRKVPRSGCSWSIWQNPVNTEQLLSALRMWLHR